MVSACGICLPGICSVCRPSEIVTKLGHCLCIGVGSVATGQRCANNNLSEQGGAEQQQMEWSSVLISSSWGRCTAEAGGRRSVSPSLKFGRVV